jgi:Tfp pilus assembly protein PilF
MHNELPDPWISELYDDCYDGYQLALAAGAAEINGDTQTAIRRLKQAIDLEPTTALYPTQLGILYRKLDRLTEAKRYLEKAIEIDPTSSDAWAYLTTVLKEQGKLIESEIALENGLKQNPGSYDLRMAKARLLTARKDYSRANDYYLAASDVRFDSAPPLIEAASNCFKLEQLDRGKALLQQALVAEPYHPLALTTLAFAAIVTHDQRLANDVLKRVKLQPRVPANDLRDLLAKYKDTFGVEAQ